MSEITTKKCYKCGEVMDVNCFHNNKSRHDGKNPMCKACIKMYDEKRIKENPEKRKATVDAYRAANIEKCRQAQKNWYNKDHERAIAVKNAWTKRNKEASSAIKAKWRHANICKTKEIAVSRKSANGNHSGEEVKVLYAKQKQKCACCYIALDDKYHKDHIIALKNGGTNDIANIQLLCQRCNLRKGARDPIEFMRSSGFLL